MNEHERVDRFASDETERTGADSYESPRFRVIPLDCEISAYAPDDGDPLF
jgi:hypothetical protein